MKENTKDALLNTIQVMQNTVHNLQVHYRNQLGQLINLLNINEHNNSNFISKKGKN